MKRAERVDERLRGAVPHGVRAPHDAVLPHGEQELAEHVGGLSGPAKHEEPRAPELGVHVGAGADASVGQARHQAAHAPAGVGIVGPLLAGGVGLVARVVHEERDVGEQGGCRADVAGVRPGRGGARNRPADALVGTDDPGPQRTHLLEERNADRLVVEEPAGRHAPGWHGLGWVPQRVHLPARRPQLVTPGLHGLDLPGPVVGVHDRVGENPAAARIAIDDLAAGGDLGVGQDVLVRLPRQGREQGDSGLAAAEHQRRPLGGRDAGRVDAPRTTGRDRSSRGTR